MDNLTITIEHLQRGQPCNYAPHTYTSRITIVGATPWDRLLENQVRDLVRSCVHYFTDEPSTCQADYYEPRLTNLVCEVDCKAPAQGAGQESVWLAEVQIPYCD